MAKWSLTKNGNIVQCKYNCKANHQHYIGTYEGAVKYFGISENEIQNYRKLINIIIYHQLSQYTVRKLSNELYDILISAMSEHKYWIPEKDRDKIAFETLKYANEKGMLMDKLILKTIDEKYQNNRNQQRRKYLFEVWYKENEGKF